MKINELMKAAAKGYPDELLSLYWDKYNHSVKNDAKGGDTLALFLVREIHDSFKPRMTSATQLKEAIRVLEAAIQDVQGVRDALMDEARKHVKEKKK